MARRKLSDTIYRTHQTLSRKIQKRVFDDTREIIIALSNTHDITGLAEALINLKILERQVRQELDEKMLETKSYIDPAHIDDTVDGFLGKAATYNEIVFNKVNARIDEMENAHHSDN